MNTYDAGIVFLPVADLERSTHFYRDLLGLPLVLDQGRCRLFHIAGDAFVGVCRRDPVETAAGIMLTLVCSHW
jgi:catechol 2,3-dioxygenase-like lactoylglutathione lyase family enzyme